MTPQGKMGRIDIVSRVIDAPPEVLYEAYMTPEYLVKWLPPEGMSGKVDKFEPEVGGQFRLTIIYGEEQSIPGKTTENTDVIDGRFLELVPHQKITTVGSFDAEAAIFSGAMTMTWYFEAIPEGTKVTVVAENVPEGIQKTDHYDGLHSTLENLANFAKESN